MPLDLFVTPQKPGRLIRPRRNKDFHSSNAINNYVRNNDRTFTIPRCRSDQLKNSFFVRTATDWNHLDNNTVHADTLDKFKTLVAANLYQ